MKAQNRRAFQNVMRSPSPDIAHRSIITNTKSPVNQIKDFMRMRQASKSPNPINTSLHQNNKPLYDTQEVNKLKRHIQQLQARIKFLQRIKISHEQLTITNHRLNNQLEGLKLQLRDNQQRSQSNSSKNISPNTVRNKSPRLKGVTLVKNQLTEKNTSQPENLQNLHTPNVPAPTDNILREFNQRILKMSEENIRLGKKLKEIYDQNHQLEKENNMLKAQKNVNIPTEVKTFNDVQSLKRYFTEETDRIAKYYQGLNESRMSQLGMRISSLQNELATNQTSGSNKRQIKSSPKEYKDGGSNNTYSRTQSQEPISSLQANRYMWESKYTLSPSEFKQGNIETSPIMGQEQGKQKMKVEKEDLQRRRMDVQGQLKMVLLENTRLQKRLRQIQSSPYNAAVYKPSPLQESNMSSYRVSQQRIQGLEDELTRKTTELRFKSMQMQELQRRLREISGFRESQTQNHMKVINQERQKTLHYFHQLQKCQHRLTELQRNTVSKHQLLSQQTQLNKIKSLYQLSQTQYSQLKANFTKYLQMLMEIRHSLTGEDMEDCLKQIEAKWTGYDQLQMEIIKVHQCHQLLLQQYKQNILEKEQTIAILQKQNLLLKEQNQQNLLLVQKLQKAIYDFSQPPRHQLTEEQLKKRFNHHQTSDKRPCLIRDYITTTNRKLGILQNQINIALQAQQEQKNQNCNRNKYTLNPVEVESIYRKTTQTLEPQEVREYSQGEQQEEEQEEIPDEYQLMGKD